jgi:hypothetical protein
MDDKLPDDKVNVKISSCKDCKNVIRVAVEHMMSEASKKEFYKEVTKFELDVKTIPLLEYRKGVDWCRCKK